MSQGDAPYPCPPLLPMLELKVSGCQGEWTWFLGLELPVRQPTNSKDGSSTQLRVKDGEVSLCLPDIRPFLGLVTASQSAYMCRIPRAWAAGHL